MNAKLKKTLKRGAIVGTGLLAFVGTVVGGYVVTPNRTKFIDVSTEEPEPTPFGQFVERLTNDVGMNEEVVAKNYLSTSFEDFEVTYSVEDSMTVNTLAVTGGADLRLSALSLKGVEFNIDVEADYNGKKLPLTMGRFKDDIYFGLKDMKIKFTEFSEEKFLNEYWFTFARYANLNLPQMLYSLGDIVEEKIGGLLDSLMNPAPVEQTSEPAAEELEEEGGFDFSSILNGGVKEVEQNDGSWIFTIGSITEDVYIDIFATSDFAIKKVELKKLSAGAVSVTGKINIEVLPYDDFVSPAAGNDYIEVFNYAGLTQKLVSLLKEDGEHQKFGLGFELNLDQVKKVESPVNIANVKGSINVDLDALLDLSQYQVTDNLIPEPSRSSTEEEEEEPASDNFSDSKIYKTIKKVGFNFQLHLIGQNVTEYANLDLVFADGQGYLRFNEQPDGQNGKKSVMKLHVDTQTMNWIVDKIPSLMDNSAEEGNETDTIETLSKFLRTDVVDAIKEGDYSFIIDMLKTLSNDENGFHLGIDLSPIGLGEDAELTLNVVNDANIIHIEDVINGELSDEEQEALVRANDERTNNSKLDIRARNLAFGSFKMNAGLYTQTYESVDLGELNEYQSISFAKDIAEQISDFVDKKQTGFEIEGSMKDSHGLGIDFNGTGQLDNNEDVKEGYGHMTINQYKYNRNDVWYSHKLAVNVTNLESNINEYQDEHGEIKRENLNKALFVYGDPNSDNIKGSMNLQTFSDIMDIVMTFVDDFADKPKFTKFLKPISEKLGMGALGSIIESKDYMHLASNKLLSEVKVIDTENGSKAIRVTVSNELLGLPAPITIVIGMVKDQETHKQKLSYLTIDGLRLSDETDAKVLNMTFRLTDYDEEFEDIVHKDETYMPLDGIKNLLDMGINTTKPNYYRLTASGGLKTKLLWTNIDFPIKNIDFHVFVDGETAKVYGSIGELPGFTGVTVDSSYDVSAEFGFQTYESGDNKVGGMFNIHRHAQKDKTGVYSNPNSWLGYSVGKYRETHDYYYRCESTKFLDAIAEYLLGGLLGLNDTVLDAIVDSSASSSSEEKPAGNFAKTFTSTGFNYSKNSAGQHVIKVGLNLNELTGIDALREVEATITSKNVAYEGLSEGFDIIGQLDATMRIHMIVDLNVNFSASVTESHYDTDDARARWNSNGENQLAAISGNIGNFVIENSQHYNAPRNPYYVEKQVAR